MTPLQARIIQLKGNMSYAEFKEAIYNKTGKRISQTGLFHLLSGGRAGRPKTIAILAEYAGKPVKWFYEENAQIVAEPQAEYAADPSPDSVAEAIAEYYAPTGDPDEDEFRRVVADAFHRDIHKLGRNPIPWDYKVMLVNLAKDLARRRKAGELE
jgi:hypothetical protein